MKHHHYWQQFRDNHLTRCDVATKNDLEIHIHGWPWSRKVRETILVSPIEDSRGYRRAYTIPDRLWPSILKASTFAEAMAMLRRENAT